MANLLGYLKNKDNDKLFLDFAYPVGSIYLSMNSTSPQTLFGGTWVQIKDEFLYCTTSSNTTGGANSVSYTPKGSVGNHTLTISEIPSHNHGYTDAGNDSTWGEGGDRFTINNPNIGYRIVWNMTTSSTGGGGAHNHGFTGTTSTINTMPKYRTCYAWYRTA